MGSAASYETARPERSSDHAQGALSSALQPMRLAAATDALDLAVEGRIFPVHRIVGIAQVLLGRYVAGPRLAMTDGRLDRRPVRTPRRILHVARRAAALRHGRFTDGRRAGGESQNC